MAALVLDASVVLAVALQEANRAHAAKLLEQAIDSGAMVPSIWHVEIGNGLLTAQRRKALSAEETAAALRHLSRLTVRVDAGTASRAWRETLALAEQHRLTLYDATYLELSLRLGLPLASFDAALRKAARNANVPLL